MNDLIHKKLTLICLLAALGILHLHAQDKEYYETNNAKESLQIAQGFINNGTFGKARKQLEHTIKIKENFGVAYRELGRVCLELGDYDAAIDAFEASFVIDDKISRAAYFECGESYFKRGEIEQALHYFKRYEEMAEGKYINKKKEIGLEKQYDAALTLRLSNIQFIQDAPKANYPEQPINMGTSINSKDNEYLPTILSNGQRIVFTRDKDGNNENVLTSVRTQDSTWTNARAFDKALNTHSNEGMAKFSTDGRKLYFTGCKRPDTNGGCDVYEAQVSVFGEVSEVTHVETINTHYWDSQPCLSCNADAIYFSSNREGGFGGTDIYVSYKDAKGNWGNPVNLGPSINTPRDEEAPYISADGQTLYFASDGWPGFGEGDLFISIKEGNHWSRAENMGAPINSSSRELGFHLSGDNKKAYFASARPGGQGGLDIYSIPLPKVFQPKPMNHVQGIIVDDLTGQPIPTEFVIRRIGERYDFKSDEKGHFFTCLHQDRAYTFHVEVEGYKTFMTAVYLPKSDNEKPVDVEIRLLPENAPAMPLVQETPPETPPTATIARSRKIEKRVFFYFDINSAELSAQTQSKLDDLINTIKFDNKWAIEVIGYADSSGNAEYNKKLSEKRANGVADYLRESGIAIEQVSQEGRGALTGDTEAEKRRSRRVEVVMRGVINGFDKD